MSLLMSRRIQLLITIAALIVLLIHLQSPIRIDATGLALLVIAVLPWLARILKSIELPGGFKVEFRELENLKQQAKESGLLANSKTSKDANFLAFFEDDPNLALAALRVEIERRLRRLEQTVAPSQQATRNYSLRRLLEYLTKNDHLSRNEYGVITDMIGTLNNAVHGAEVDPKAAEWVITVGPEVLAALDNRIHEAETKLEIR